jgi:hypothetical protein
MIRNPKALGLALVAVFAMSAMATSAASAQQGELTSKPVEGVTLIGSETGEAGSNALTAFGLRIECPQSTYTGHKYSETPHTLIPNGATTVTLTPDYKEENHNCRSFPGNFPMTVSMNGCDYVLHFGETTGEKGLS